MHYPSATQPNWCRGRRRVRRDRRARLRCRLRPVGRANTGSQGQHQINFAHNFPRSLFETTRKRCNSNELISMFKQVARELRAKLLRRRQGPRQTNFACNSIRPNFNKPRKRCNSNDANSMFEQAAGELHAKLMSDSHNWATYSNPGPGRGARGWRQGLLSTFSHAIRLDQNSTNSENVAIPTMQIQCLNKLRGNCMRN